VVVQKCKDIKMTAFPDKIVVGVTGGIACGKSTVCTIFETLGWTQYLPIPVHILFSKRIGMLLNKLKLDLEIN
jgi:hypothetical protein